MTEIFIDALKDALIDTSKLIPFLFLTFLVMEWLERKTEDKSKALIANVGRVGPLVGGALGILPQCGFSAAAASLYSGGILSIGTLLAVFLSTSDEMLPIFISEQVPPATILKLLLTKALLGILAGFAVDFTLRFTRYRYKTEKRIHDVYEHVHHHHDEEEEEGGILFASVLHTLHIVLFIFGISLVLTILVEGFGEEAITSILSGRPIIGTFLAGIIGLIPNCAASVTLTQLYLSGMLGSGQLMAGLLVGAGVGLLVLFRTNKSLKESVKITGMLYVIGVALGLIIEILGVSFM